MSNLLFALIVVAHASCEGLDIGTEADRPDMISAAKSIVENPVNRQNR